MKKSKHLGTTRRCVAQLIDGGWKERGSQLFAILFIQAEPFPFSFQFNVGPLLIGTAIEGMLLDRRASHGF